jgi:hypothetical protein
VVYLFDANVLITLNNTYYAIDQVPEYWDWVQYQAETGNIKIPVEIMSEILAGKDSQKAKDDRLLKWIVQSEIRKALVLDEKVNDAFVRQIIENGYGPKVTDLELEVIGRDPFLVAYGMANPGSRCIVTTEASAPSRQRQNRQLPNVCEQFGVPWCPPTWDSQPVGRRPESGTEPNRREGLNGGAGQTEIYRTSRRAKILELQPRLPRDLRQKPRTNPIPIRKPNVCDDDRNHSAKPLAIRSEAARPKVTAPSRTAIGSCNAKDFCERHRHVLAMIDAISGNAQR